MPIFLFIYKPFSICCLQRNYIPYQRVTPYFIMKKILSKWKDSNEVQCFLGKKKKHGRQISSRPYALKKSYTHFWKFELNIFNLQSIKQYKRENSIFTGIFLSNRIIPVFLFKNEFPSYLLS